MFRTHEHDRLVVNNAPLPQELPILVLKAGYVLPVIRMVCVSTRNMRGTFTSSPVPAAGLWNERGVGCGERICVSPYPPILNPYPLP